MLKNYIKTAFRTLWKDKVHTAINAGGLAVGLACCLLILLFIQHEWSFDRFHAKTDQIYRAWVLEDYGEDEQFFNSVTPVILGPTMEATFPEVEAIVRVDFFGTQVRRGNETFDETVSFADPTFFDVFDFALERGERAAQLADPNGIVITPAIVARYFGSEDPIGQTLSVRVNDAFEDLVVTGIAAPTPANSSIQFDLLVSMEFAEQIYSEGTKRSWTNVSPETYVLLRDDVTGPALEAKLPTMIQQVFGNRYVEGEFSVGLQPITDIHLNPDIPAGAIAPSDPAYSYILGAVALFILLIACINFMTLSIGRSMDRALEVGVRKAIGAGRRQLMVQFWGEAVLMTVLALGLGIALALTFLPLFNALSGRELVFALDAGMMVSIVVLALLISFVAGSYPAAVLSGFRPVEVLKGKIRVRGDRSLVRQGLVVVQFALSIFLIASTIIMQQQLTFLQDKNLGFDKEQVVIIPTGLPTAEGYDLAERFRNEVADYDAVVSLSASAFTLNDGWAEVGYTDDQDRYREFNINRVDHNYLATMGMELVAGRDFSRTITSDERQAVIVNEAFVQEYGWDNAIGQRLPGANFEDHAVVGVVRDFHYQSLREAVAPAMLVLTTDAIFQGIENAGFRSSPRPDLSVRLKPGDLPGTLALLEATWARTAPDRSFDFYFLDDAVNTQYQAEMQLGRIVRIASLLAILIACLGLFGLAALAAARRTKEIGVRKVLGASVGGIVGLLSRDFVRLVVIGFVLAVPLTYFAMTRWLADFAYHIEPGVGVFVLAGLLALAIALVTVSYQSIKAALRDPVKSLRYE